MLKRAILSLILIYCSSTLAVQDWYDNLIFKDKSFTYEFIRTIGYTYSGGADIGEAISTAREVQDGDINQWFSKWLNLGDRLYALGDHFSRAKNLASAQAAYFRASNYFRSASFYMDAPSLRSKGIHTWQHSRLAFLKAITHLPYIRTVRIPYEKTTLPGYFIQSKIKNAPLLIVNTGFDGTAEELYFATGQAAHKRGYNVLMMEGPGQGEMIKQQKIPFRPDWEKVITPVINFAVKLPDIDTHRIALMGLSMGGYLAARAAAFEPRIKAVILNGGVYDFSESVTSNIPTNLRSLVTSDPKKFNQFIQEQMQKDTNTNWFFNNGMWVFGVNYPADVLKKLKAYTVAGFIDKIAVPTLVIDSTGDSFFRGQPERVYHALRSPKTLLVFTADGAAQAHCQAGANAISNERIYSWLDQTFNWHPVMIN